MAFTRKEVEQWIRLELKTWGLTHFKVQWCDWERTLGEAWPSDHLIKLSNKCLDSFAVLKEVLKHEIAHVLQWLEQGKTFVINGRHQFHNKTWKKYCLTVGCKPRRIIPT